MVTLGQILLSRDNRRLRQEELLGSYPGKTLICMTVSLPGPLKRDRRTGLIAEAGLSAVRELFPEIIFEEVRDLDTGFEAYLVVPIPPYEAKNCCCRIEDTHPLGRLMDLDVVVPDSCKDSGKEDGQAAALPVPLSRGSIGLAPRRCLICDRPAKECMRSRAHSTEELLKIIDELLENGLNP